MSRFALSLLAASSVALAACVTRPPLPAETAPEPFVLTRDLAGRTQARGEFSAINGVRRSFVAVLDGKMEGETFVLREEFAYADGERDVKTWRLTPSGDGEWRGTREDVVGEARGYVRDGAFRLEYLMDIPQRGKKPLRVRFRDVLVRTTSGDVLNKAIVSKYGFAIGRVELLIGPAANQ
jgi:hypothetical protein